MLSKNNLLNAKSVYKKLGISKSFFYSKVLKEKDFPTEILLGGNERRWVEIELDNWIESKKVGRV